MLIQLTTGYMRKPKKESTYLRRYAQFQCECGIEFETQVASVKNKTCNKCKLCRKKEQSQQSTKHKLSNHPIYHAYNHILQRTENIKNKGYDNYGGRGIKMCDHWKKDFMNFYNDLIGKYSNNLSLHRIDNNGDYEPDNCIWTDVYIQNQTTQLLRKTNTSGYRGVSKANQKTGWIAAIDNNGKRYYLGTWKTKKEAAMRYNKFITDNNTNHPQNTIWIYETKA